MLEYIIIALLAVAVVLLIVLITKKGQGGSREFYDIMSENQKNIGDMQLTRLDEMRKTISDSQQASSENLKNQLHTMEERLRSLEKSNEQRLDNLRTTVSASLENIRKDNNEKLETMRKTVDEKLEKTLQTKMTESFRLVSERLEQVYKGLGEMQTLASGVGDLKKVLSNVKSRGILGEIQLGAILEDILPRDRYEVNFATVPGSRDVVEFAIKLPGDNEKPVYLPVDSKFPADCYYALQAAYEAGNTEEIKKARNEMIARLKSFAKDIRTKYIAPPDTTDFAIMFLPFESLYAEAVNCGMVEILQRDFHVNIAGPGTMAALLNSLQMGFRTLAIEKRSAEVWKILGAVKTEFDKFSDILEKTRKKLGQIDNELDTLIGTRTAAIKRKLRDVESISDNETKELLESDE